MRNKKISALLLVMAMLVTLVVPVQAAADSAELLTRNTTSDAFLAAATTVAGKTITAISDDANDTTVSFTEDMFVEASGGEAKLTDGGYIGRDTWSNWGAGNASHELVIDLGGVQTVEGVMMFILTKTANGSNSLGCAESEVLSEANMVPSVTSIKAEYSETGEDGTYTTFYDGATPTVNSDCVFHNMNGTVVDRISHGVNLAIASPAQARYIKLTCVEASYNMAVAEIAVYGDATAKVQKSIITGNTYSDTIKAFVERKLPKAEVSATGSLANALVKMNVTQARSAYTSAELQDGVVDNRHTESGWGDDTAIVEIDLMKAKQIENVLIWKTGAEFWANNGGQWKYTAPTESTKNNYLNRSTLRSIVVKTSDDGETWTAGETINAEELTADDVVLSTPTGATHTETGEDTYQRIFYGYNFALSTPVTSRYVQLEINYTSQGELSEIMLIGKEDTTGASRKVISGNGLANSSSDIVDVYAGEGIDLTVINGDAVFSAFDFTPNANYPITYLQQGKLSCDHSSNVMWELPAAWPGVLTKTFAVDLGKTMKVSGVDLCIWRNGSGKGPKSFEVRVSNSELSSLDGTSAVFTSDYGPCVDVYGSGETNCQQLSVYDFEPVKGRYVYITMTYQNQMVPNEIMIIGDEVPSATAPVFVDASGGDFIENWGNSGLSVKTTFTGVNGVLVAALYDLTGNAPILEQVWVQDATAGTETTLVVDTEGEVSSNIYNGVEAGEYEFKAFAFDSLTAITPLGVSTLNLGE